MTHPDLERLRRRSDNRRARDRHILDVHFGPLDLTPPTITTIAEHEAHELACRQHARDITADPNVRDRLAQLEAQQRAEHVDVAGLTLPAPGIDYGDEAHEQLLGELLAELHRAATLVDVIRSTPIPTPDPVEQALRTLGVDPTDMDTIGVTINRDTDTLSVEPITVDSDRGKALQFADMPVRHITSLPT